uniref:Ribosomal protein L18a n=1 Tax=Amorphochlora amoebiformis TaxID=1561963 RepID=A0A0H5BHR5_9EUKA|nr:ribosomal protein L18a [Amorphochlora amoebiformis]
MWNDKSKNNELKIFQIFYTNLHDNKKINQITIYSYEKSSMLRFAKKKISNIYKNKQIKIIKILKLKTRSKYRLFTVGLWVFYKLKYRNTKSYFEINDINIPNAINQIIQLCQSYYHAKSSTFGISKIKILNYNFIRKSEIIQYNQNILTLPLFR